MRYTQKDVIVMIMHGQSCGMSHFVMDIPEDFVSPNKAMDFIMKESIISITPYLIECMDSSQGKIVSITCKMENFEKANYNISYNVSPMDYITCVSYFGKKRTIKSMKDSQKTIFLIKKIIDSYDPFIQVESD